MSENEKEIADRIADHIREKGFSSKKFGGMPYTENGMWHIDFSAGRYGFGVVRIFRTGRGFMVFSYGSASRPVGVLNSEDDCKRYVDSIASNAE